MGLYHHFQTAITFENFIPFIKYAYISLKQSYKTHVKKNLMRIILFRTYKHLKLYIILYIFHVEITFFIYQTMHSLPKNSGLYSPNFANVSNITMKIKQFQVFSLMRILIVNV